VEQLDGQQSPSGVDVAAYVLDDAPVTAASYRECVEADGCGDDGVTGVGLCARFGPSVGYGQASFSCLEWASDAIPSCNFGRGLASEPMNCVTWLQAATYCRWVGKRLPTQGEFARALQALGHRAVVIPQGHRIWSEWLATTPSCGQRKRECDHILAEWGSAEPGSWTWNAADYRGPTIGFRCAGQ
jgi:formylglycine-generating enzyme required for sulfatase activity